MSHYTILQTRIIDADALVKALADLGFAELEVHETAQGLYGYQGDVRSESAEIIIRRQHIGPASNDIGFRRLSGGVFQAIISEHDRDQYGQPWLERLHRRYAYHITRQRLEAQGFTVTDEETDPNGQIRLVLRRVN